MLKKTLETVLTVLPHDMAERSRQPARQATTMWGLLVWAYKRELVRVAEFTSRPGPPRAAGSNTSAVCRVLRSGIVGSGPVARITHMRVHPDAEWVHGLVRTLDRDEFWLMVGAAEADKAPEWEPHCEPARVEPDRKSVV